MLNLTIVLNYLVYFFVNHTLRQEFVLFKWYVKISKSRNDVYIRLLSLLAGGTST